MIARLLFILALASAPLLARGAAGDAEWQAVQALDAGPATRPKSAAEAETIITAHWQRQEAALRAFLSAAEADPRAFEARLRLARVLALRGGALNQPRALEEASKLLDRLEPQANAAQRTEVDFTRITLRMRAQTTLSLVERDDLLARTRQFQARHPEDRRVAGLLAEVATLFDLRPTTKRALLLDAQALAREPDLQQQIRDDLRRLDLLGKEITLSGPALAGGTLSLTEMRGRPVVIIFFAAWSGPSLATLDTLQTALKRFPKERLAVLGVSLDTKKEPLAAVLREKALAWPVIYDGQGWESPHVRALGINALPAAWLLDRTGKLRSLDALQSPVSQVEQLLAE